MGSLVLEFEGAGVAKAAGCSGPGASFPLMSAPATYLHDSLSTSGCSSRLADSPSLMSWIVNLSAAVHAHIKTHVASTNAGIAVFFGFMWWPLVVVFHETHCESRNGRDDAASIIIFDNHSSCNVLVSGARTARAIGHNALSTPRINTYTNVQPMTLLPTCIRNSIAEPPVEDPISCPFTASHATSTASAAHTAPITS